NTSDCYQEMREAQHALLCIFCFPMLVLAFFQPGVPPADFKVPKNDIAYINRATSVPPRIRQDRALTPSRCTAQEVEKAMACRAAAEALAIAGDKLCFSARLCRWSGRRQGKKGPCSAGAWVLCVCVFLCV